MIIENAMKFLQAGIGIIPVGYRDKRPDFRNLPTDASGHPSWEIFKTTLPDVCDLQRWFSSANNNYGVVAGWQGLCVLDFDDMAEYSHWLFWAAQVGKFTKWVAENAFRVSTNRGVHVYIRLPHHEKNRKVGKIDIKGDGYVLGPGSVHPSGKVYISMRSSWNFPMIQALSDVLPAALLVSPNTEPIPVSAAANPWAARPSGQQVGGSLVKKIRGSYRIEDFFPAAKQTGAHWLMTTCPLHDDHNPSFWIDTERQICGCFSGCTPLPLDVINLYARMHGLNNSDALAVMAGGL